MASKLGDITELCQIAQPTHGIITNIGKAHLEEFKNISNIIKTKTELWKYIIKTKGVIFLNTQDNLLSKEWEKPIYSKYKQVFNYGTKKENIIFLSASPFLKFKWINNVIKTKIVGEYNLINIIAAIKIGIHFGLDNKKIADKLKNNKSNNNRSELIKTKNNQIILDAYNANPSSMKTSIENFINIKTSHSKILIIGDMLELGANTISLHQEIINFLINSKFANCMLVGSFFYKTNSDFLKFKTKKNLETFLKKKSITNTMILIKGSRKMKLETLKELL